MTALPPPSEYILLSAIKSRSISEKCYSTIKEQKGKSDKSKRRVSELKNRKPRLIGESKSEVSISKRSSVEETSENQLIPSPKTPKDPQDNLKKSLIRLKCSLWNEAVFALQEIVQISRFNPGLLTNYMPAVYKGISNLLKNVWVTPVRTACQTANELFINITSVQGPELEDLVHGLLQKTVESNKLVMKDALEALDSMVLHVPPAYSSKILLHKKVSGFNLAARTTAAKLLACIANIINCEPGTDVSDDVKARMATAAVKFLQDDCSTIRMHGMKLVSLLMQEKEFNRILQRKLSVSTLNKVDEMLQIQAKGQPEY